MSALVACDLDRTLIYSPKAFWLETPDPEAPSIIVSELWNGVPISFMTRESERLLIELRSQAVFMPVTTRTVAQYQRVQLPGGAPAYAITSNGGEILVDGVPDADWRDRVRAHLTDHTAPLDEALARFEELASPTWILKTNVADALFFYSIVERDAIPAGWLEQVELECERLGWTVSLQGRKLYCVPRTLTKHDAVSEVARRLDDPLVLAAGDSLLDQSMLETADLAFRPAHGELDDEGFTIDTLTVTERRGILAGEELLQLMTAAAVRGR